jgi:3-oxoacyl-[acyl-carrier protein] reductase
MGSLEGKVAVITGAASGFGAATSRTFIAEGAKVVLADANGAGAEALAAELGENAVAIRVDVRLAAEVEAMIDFAESRFGGLDVLINNAGITSQVGPAEELSEEDFDRVVAINVKGVFLGVKFAVPALHRRGGGVILNTASVGGVRPRGNAGIYYPTKAAVINYTQALATELGPSIRVNCVSPSLAPTNFVTGAQGGDAVKAAAVIQAGLPATGIPLARICDPQDVANAFAFLASDKASYVSGLNMLVDGGLAAGLV